MRKTDSQARQIFSWICVLVIAYVFLSSLPYKFSGAPETQHIFSTIGKWLAGFLGAGIGDLFSRFGAYVIGSLELVTSVILLLPILYWVLNGKRKNSVERMEFRQSLHAIGGLAATALMGGAVFFHLFTPLGINVNNDNGALFYSALTVFFLGTLLFLLNKITIGVGK